MFAKNGINATTLDDIAKKVGVTKPTLYHYYSSKEDICADIFSQMTFNASRILELADQADDIEDKLQIIGVHFLRIMKKPPSLASIILQRVFSNVSQENDEIREIFVRHLDGRISVLGKLINEFHPKLTRTHCEALAAQFMNSLTNYWLTEHFLRRKTPTDTAIENYVSTAVALVTAVLR